MGIKQLFRKFRKCQGLPASGEPVGQDVQPPCEKGFAITAEGLRLLDSISPMKGRPACPDCATPSEVLCWFKAVREESQSGHLSVCPACGKIVEFIPKVFEIDTKSLLADSQSVVKQRFNENPTLNTLYFTKPLKGTRFVEGLSETDMISCGRMTKESFGRQFPEVLEPKSVRECAEEFYVYHIADMLGGNEGEMQQVRDVYRSVMNTYDVDFKTVAEVKNNVAVLGMMTGDGELHLFVDAARGGSLAAVANIIGYCYEARNRECADYWSLWCSDSWNIIGQFNIALKYHLGLDRAAPDLALARRYYLKAASHSLSEYPPEMEEVVGWCRAAAMRNVVELL